MQELTQREFENSYIKIYNSLIQSGIPQKRKCVVFLGGQPGAGKSSFIEQDDLFSNYIRINGDEYRKYHPHIDEIIAYDLDNLANRTQEFVNLCVERLIGELSEQGYNLIIEGTLRDPLVTISTCENLKMKGYTTNLYIIAADAATSWESTINRAHLTEEMGETPRLVPIDKYNYIVNHLPKSVEEIENAACFDKIHVIDRNSKILYPGAAGQTAAEVLEKCLELDKWNEVYEKKANEFIDAKVEILQTQRRRRGR